MCSSTASARCDRKRTSEIERVRPARERTLISNEPAASGQRISVLVDPRDPSYSELPGLPDDLPLETAVATALIIVLLTVAVVASLVAAFRKLLRRPRDQPSLPVA